MINLDPAAETFNYNVSVGEFSFLSLLFDQDWQSYPVLEYTIVKIFLPSDLTDSIC